MATRKEEQTLLGSQRVNGRASIVPNGSSDTEKQPFLHEPVRLTPAWEETNLPNDELNFKGMTMERAKMEIDPPTDKYKLVFFTLMIHGIGTLMPWNMFITAKSYFVDYKLAGNPSYVTNFMPYLGFASQIPNVLFNWLNIFVRVGGSLTSRIVITIIIEVVVFIFTAALAVVDSSSWTSEFFWITMATVVVLNIAGGIYQNSVYGMAAKLPFKYTGAVVLGSNISGTFASIISILSSYFSSVRTAAIYYFITAMFVLLVCFDTYFALPLNKFYRYHEMLAEKENEKNRRAGADINATPPYWKIFKQAFPQLINVFLVFFVTLTVFPAIHSDIQSSDPDNLPFDKNYFTTVTCFLTFNVFAMLGSLTTSWITWPKPSGLIWPVLLRLVFIPAFVFCNYLPKEVKRELPIYINNDWVYWSIAIVMSFSSGYLSSLGMMYAPQTVAPQHASTAAMFAASMLITGIFSGILFSSVFPDVVKLSLNF